jgi:hypothetical protein
MMGRHAMTARLPPAMTRESVALAAIAGLEPVGGA